MEKNQDKIINTAINLAQVLNVCRVKKLTILIYAVCCSFFVYFIGFFLVSYTAEGQVFLRPLNIETTQFAPDLGFVNNQSYDPVLREWGNYRNILTGDKVVRGVVNELELDKPYRQVGTLGSWIEKIKQPIRLFLYGRLPAIDLTPEERAMDKLSRGIMAGMIPATSIMSIAVSDSNAMRTAEVTNKLMEAFVQTARTYNTLAAFKVITFVEKELKKTRADITLKHGTLNELRGQHDITVTTGVDSEIVRLQDKLRLFKDELESNRFETKTLQNELTQLEADIEKLPQLRKISYQLTLNPHAEALKGTLFDLQLEKERLSLDYPPGSGRIKLVEMQIEKIKSAIEVKNKHILSKESYERDSNRERMLSDKIIVIKKIDSMPFLNRQLELRIDEHIKKLVLLDSMKQEFSSLEQSLAVLEGNEEKLIATLLSVRQIASRGFTDIHIIERAKAPRYPTLHNVSLGIYVVFGFIGGVLWGITVILHHAWIRGELNSQPV